jgi:hypothetical protein
VLELPTVEASYLAGRHRQALRTNLRHAHKQGLTCDRVDTYDTWHEAAQTVIESRSDREAAVRDIDLPWHGQAVAYYLAHDADKTPPAFARVALFGRFGVLSCMLSHHGRPNASWARYQLHTFLAMDLGASGVQYLLVGSALRESVGNEYFQHLLGYRARNLRVEVVDPAPSERRDHDGTP